MKLKNALNTILEKSKETGNIDILQMVQYMEPIFRQQGFRQREESAVETILVIRFAGIGDAVLISGMLRELRNNYPKARITLVTNKQIHQLVKYCPYINEIYIYKGNYKGDFVEKFTWAIELCEAYLWEKHFSLCFYIDWDIDQSFALPLAYFSGAIERIGYSAKINAEHYKMDITDYDLFLTKAIIPPKGIIQDAARNYFFLHAAGLKVYDKSLEIWYNQDDYLTASKMLQPYIKQKSKIIVVATGGTQNNKIYPKEMYLQAFKLMQADNIVFVLLGGPDDYDNNKYIADRLKAGKAVNLAGKTNIHQSCAVVAMADLYIGNDTGPAHIAAAAHIPVIEVNREALECPKTIFSVYERFLPWQTPAIVLRPLQALNECHEILLKTGISIAGCRFNKPHCITQIKPNQIVEAYRRMKHIIYK